jgi:hypothetical protein
MPAPNTTLFRATRGLLWLLLALVIAAALIVAGVAIALVVAWPDVMAAMRGTPELVDVTTIRFPLGILMLLLIAVLGVAAYIFRQLQALVASASRDPFVIDNAARLRRIGWSLVTIQLLALPVHWTASSIATAGSDFSQMGGISIGSLLSILLAFVLAAVFEQGAAMRDELEGTV